MIMADETPTPKPSPRRRRIKPVQAVVGLLLLLLVIAAGVYLTSPQFERLVRGKVVAQLEQITGGRVELKSLHWNLSKLDVEIDDLTIHGLEAANEVPYAHIDHASIHAKIIDLFQKKIGLSYLALTRPVIHIIVYPDGSTNQPTPKTKSANADPVQQVFDLAVDLAVLSNGTLLWNDRKIPFDVAANQLAAGLTFSPNTDPNLRQYNINIKIGELSAAFKGSRPILSNAETQIALRPNAADIKVLRWSSPRSRFEASGNLTDLKDPQIALQYRATFDAREAAALLKIPALRGGALDLDGKANYHASEYASSGNIAIHNLTYRDKSINVADLSANARFSIDPRRVTLDGLNAALFAGKINGNLEVADWSDAKKQRGRARISLAGVSLERALSAVSASPLLKRVRIDSSAAGTINASWIGSPSTADAVIALHLAPSANTPDTSIPLAGVVNATYKGRANALDLSQLELHTRGTQLSARGSLGLAHRANANLQFTLATQDLNEFTPVLAALNLQKPPLALHGAANLSGAVSGTLSDPQLLAHLAVTDFDTILPTTPTSPPAAPNVVNASQTTAPAAPAPAKDIHWDSLTADLDYTPDAVAVHNGALRRGSANINFDANATLRHRVGRPPLAYPTKDIPFTAHVKVQNANLADVQSLAGYNYPITGTLQANLDVSGTQNDLKGGGTIQLNHGAAYGNPFRTLQADLRFSGKDVQIPRLYFNQLTATINGNARYNLATKVFAVNLQGSGFELSKIKQIQNAKVSVSGNAKFNLQASGTVQTPAINAHAELDNLVARGEKFGKFTLDAATHGDTLHLTGRTSFQTATLDLDGDVRLRGDYPGNLKLVFANFDIDPLIKLFMPQSSITAHSTIAGEIDAAGPLKTPKLLAINANIPAFHLSIDKFNIDSQGPILFSLRDQVARIDQFHLIAADTDINATGTAALSGTRAINAALKGNIDLKLLQTLDPSITSSGRTTIDITARGTIDKPALRGEIDLQDANIAYIDLPNGLSKMNGRLVFNQNRLVVRQFTARTGGGDLNLGGFIAYQNGVYFDLTATGTDVRVRYPQGVSSSANADLHLLGTLKGATLSGDLTVTKFAMNPSFDFALYVARSKQPPSVPDPNSILNKVRLNVHVSSSPELAVQTSVATLTGDVDVDVRGTVLNPIILGRVSIAEGDIFFNGTRYHLNRGDVTFTNPVRIDPILNVDASATIRDFDITIGFHGPLDRLSTTYRSEPPLPTTDIISLLAFQRTTEQSASASQTSFSENAQNAVLGQALNAAVSSRVQKLLGFSKVKIDPTGGGLEQNQPSITVEQQVANKLTITFITFPTLANQQVIQVEYNVNRNVSIVGIRDQYGVLAIDVRLRQRKR